MLNLAEVLYFASCTIIIKGEKSTIWFAALKWLMDHQGKVWFGCGAQHFSQGIFIFLFHPSNRKLFTQIMLLILEEQLALRKCM